MKVWINKEVEIICFENFDLLKNMCRDNPLITNEIYLVVKMLFL